LCFLLNSWELPETTSEESIFLRFSVLLFAIAISVLGLVDTTDISLQADRFSPVGTIKTMINWENTISCGL
jgi:hypothetical protein